MTDQITLCLSGGGFRASIFHLGVIDYLVQADLLSRVSSLYGVSGGAITAAHLAHCWEAYSDKNLYSSAALALLERCHLGILDQVVWSSLAWQKNRTFEMARNFDSLFKSTISSNATPTYLVCSSISDTSQFAIEIVSGQLFHLLKGQQEVRSLGKVRDSLTTSVAVAMSACFPLAFEPVTLGRDLTGLNVGDLGGEFTIVDGGVVDNFGIAMAHQIERDGGDGHLFLISDAGRLFDDMDSKEAERATMLSPMRTIDYLLNQNAASTLARVGSVIAQRKSRIAVIKLEDARKATTDLRIDSGLVRAAMDLRTSFDSFSVGEIVTVYRLGILLARNTLAPTFGQPQSINFSLEGLIRGERLGDQLLDVPWSEVKISAGSGALGTTIETVLRKPGLAILFVGLALFGTAVALGIVARALLRF
jgi:predicted acylesterase/phospholipase RssA